jgi:hypothetical protein
MLKSDNITGLDRPEGYRRLRLPLQVWTGPEGYRRLRLPLQAWIGLRVTGG